MPRRKMYMHINFQHIWVSRLVKTVNTNIFLKKCKLHKFATCNSNFEKSRLSDMYYPVIHIQADFETNRPIRYQIAAIGNYFHRRQTDGRTDRRRVRQQKVVFFKKK